MDSSQLKAWQIDFWSWFLVTQPQSMYVSGAHNSAVTCVEWCPDGELLYSGDIHGKVYVTVVKFQEVQCTVDYINFYWQSLLFLLLLLFLISHRDWLKQL